MSVVIRLKVPIEMHYDVIPMGTSKVNSSPNTFLRYNVPHSHATLRILPYPLLY